MGSASVFLMLASESGFVVLSSQTVALNSRGVPGEGKEHIV